MMARHHAWVHADPAQRGLPLRYAAGTVSFIGYYREPLGGLKIFKVYKHETRGIYAEANRESE